MSEKVETVKPAVKLIEQIVAPPGVSKGLRVESLEVHLESLRMKAYNFG